MKKEKKIIDVLQTMDGLFADYPLTELEYTNPFQLLVAVMLSAQTTDKQVNKVTKQFFQVVTQPADILTLGESGVKEYIKTVGLHVSKTKNLVKTAQMLTDMTHAYKHEHHNENIATNHEFIGRENFRDNQYQYDDGGAIYKERGYWIPDTLKQMQTLAGVGVKTAKVVLYVLYGQRRVAVDTHVHRVMNRLGIVDTKTPEKTSDELEVVIPDAYKDLAHRVIIYFGRYLCTAKKPQCGRCPFASWCPSKQE